MKAELKKLYPDAGSVTWSSHEKGTTDASFVKKGKRIRVLFKDDILFADMMEINKDELPEAVKSHLKSYYKGYSTVHAYKMKILPNTKDKNIRYWISLEKGQRKTSIICYSNGDEMTAFSKRK